MESWLHVSSLVHSWTNLLKAREEETLGVPHLIGRRPWQGVHWLRAEGYSITAAMLQALVRVKSDLVEEHPQPEVTPLIGPHELVLMLLDHRVDRPEI